MKTFCFIMRRINRLCACIIAFSLCALPTASANASLSAPPPILILTQAVETSGETPSDAKGFFNALWSLLSQGGPRTHFKAVPVNRRAYLFKNDETSCLFPFRAMKNPEEVSGERLQSDIIMKMNVRLFSKPGTPLIRNLQDLKGKTISLPEYAHVQNIIPVPYTRVALAPLESRIQVLLNNRVDVVMVASPPADLYVRSKGISERLYDPALNMMILPISLTCHHSGQNQTLIEAVNANLKRTQDNGSLQTLFEAYGLPYDEFRVLPEDREQFHYMPAK